MYKRACVCVCAHTPVCVQLGVCVCRGGDFPVLLMRGTQLSLSVLLWADIPLAPTNTDDRGKMERRWKEQLDQSGDAESRKRRCTGRRSLGFHSSIFYANSNILNYKGWTDAAETWRKCYINIVKRVFLPRRDVRIVLQLGEMLERQWWKHTCWIEKWRKKGLRNVFLTIHRNSVWTEI